MKKYTYSEDKRIYVFDDVFSFAERSFMYEFALNSKFKFERGAYPFPEAGSNVFQLMSGFSETDVVNFGVFENKAVQNLLEQHGLFRYEIVKARLNACLSSDVYQVHADMTDPDFFTLLYFVNLDWKPEWEGETIFTESDAKEIFCSVAFVPGRVVLFNSCIPHKSSQPSTRAPYHRFVFNCVVKKHGN